MATIDQAPPDLSGELTANEGNRALNSVLARAYTLNWEILFYVVILVLAVFTRFVNLGDRVMSHDESLHTKYSFDLYKQGLFKHTPLMHGPVLFHMTALSYFLFGDSDFSARVYPAVLGVIMVMMPWLLFKRWLGRFGAMAASILILISPMLLFHHRYIREDTPAIFFTILMAYSVFAYIDGARPRQTWQLLLFSAATLLNLASKETAFMYILIFAAFFGLYLLLQMLQGWRLNLHSPAVGWATVGIVAVPALGALATLIVSRLGVTDNLPEITNLGPLAIPNTITALILTILIGVLLALVMAVGLFFLYRFVWSIVLQRPVLGAFNLIGVRGNSIYKLVLAGIIIGSVAALVMTNALSIIPPESVRRSQEAWSNYEAQQATDPLAVAPADPHPNTLLGRLLIWTTSLVLLLALATIGTAVLRFNRLPRLPWFDILLVAIVAIAVCMVLIFLEERSRLIPNVSSEVRPVVNTFQNIWIYGCWVIAILAVGGIAFLRFRTDFWQEMRRYPTFDVVIVLGSMVLPWVAALPIFLAGYQLDKSDYTATEISAMFMAVLPFVLVSLAAGLSWRADVWLLNVGVFYGLFAFFFTTIFTNAEGVATGLVGSLGYWLAQQGVRRGSQPQYYYMLIQLPIYEYLAMIGAAFVGMSGLGILWRFRAGRYTEAIRSEQAARAAAIEAQQAEQQAAGFTGYGEASPETDGIAETFETAERVDPADPGLVTQANAQTVALEDLAQGEEAAHEAYEEKPKAKRGKAYGEIPTDELLERPLFLPFVGFWGLMILMALTLAGEKMPWLTTHITLPFLLLTGWYIGTQMERINWQTFWKTGWYVIPLVMVVIVGLVNVVGPLFLGGQVFGGLQRQEQIVTFAWFGFLILGGLALYALYRIWVQVGIQQLMRVGIVGLFVLLGVLTARTAWMAAYLNYDNASEFLVYAHAAPANKTVMNYIEELSRRTTDGMNIKVAYDNEVSWPGSWYFRNYTQARYLGDTTGATGLDEYLAIVVGDNNAPKIEAQLADKFYRFDYIRLWWPMQEYFNLTLKRVDDALGDAEMRQALWDIWWNRDYARYTTAYARMTGNNDTKFELDKWPVSDRMVFYVRKDIAAQLWDFGIGQARVSGLPQDPFANLRCDTCTAEQVYDQSAGLSSPRDMAVGPDGTLYVADSRNGRIVLFDAAGNFAGQFGTPTTATEAGSPPAPGTFREPWGVDVGRDGTIYVADTWNHRVQVLAKDGTPLRMWGQFEQFNPNPPPEAPPASPVGFYGPRAIAVDAQNRVYVADTGNKRVRVYDSQGNLLRDIGQQGREPGKLYEPVGLAINDELGELYVASTWNKRIDVFTLQGQFLRSWDVQAWFATTDTTDTGSRPYIALDPTGRYLFVTDPDQGRVLVYDTNGTPVVAFGRLGAAPFEQLKEFGALGGLSVDANGNVLLADAQSNRVLRFAPNSLPGVNMRPLAPLPQPTDEVTSEATGESTAEPTAVPTSNDF